MSYYGFVVTDSGRELIAKLVAGQQLPISKIMVGMLSSLISYHSIFFRYLPSQLS